MFYVRDNGDGTYSVLNQKPATFVVSGEGILPDCFDEALTALNNYLMSKGLNKPLTLKPE